MLEFKTGLQLDNFQCDNEVFKPYTIPGQRLPYFGQLFSFFRVKSLSTCFVLNYDNARVSGNSIEMVVMILLVCINVPLLCFVSSQAVTASFPSPTHLFTTNMAARLRQFGSNTLKSML